MIIVSLVVFMWTCWNKSAVGLINDRRAHKGVHPIPATSQLDLSPSLIYIIKPVLKGQVLQCTKHVLGHFGPITHVHVFPSGTQLLWGDFVNKGWIIPPLAGCLPSGDYCKYLRGTVDMKITLTNGYTSLDKHWWVCGSDGEKDEWERYWKGRWGERGEEEEGKDGNVVKTKSREGERSGTCGGERSDITEEDVGKNRWCDWKKRWRGKGRWDKQRL